MDRSTFLLITTIVSPSASRANTVVLPRMNSISWEPTNRGWIAAVTATNTASTAMMPNSRIRNTRSVSRRELTLAGGPDGSRRAVTVVLNACLPPSRALRWLREACPRRRDTATAPGAPHAAFGPAAAARRCPWLTDGVSLAVLAGVVAGQVARPLEPLDGLLEPPL